MTEPTEADKILEEGKQRYHTDPVFHATVDETIELVATRRSLDATTARMVEYGALIALVLRDRVT